MAFTALSSQFNLSRPGPIGFSLLLAVGLCLAFPASTASAQLPKFSCRPNDAGDGWVCAQISGNPAPLPIPTQPATGSNADAEQPTPGSDNPAADSDEEAASEPDEEPEPATETEPEPQSLSTLTSSYPLDWVPLAALTAEQRESLPYYCCGRFVDPLAGLAGSDSDPADADTEFLAASGLTQVSQDVIQVDGDIIITQGNRRIRNDQTTRIDRAANTVLMEGNVQLREPGLLLNGSAAEINSDTSSNRIEAAQYVLHDFGAHGSAAAVVYNGETDLISIDNGQFSRCEPGNEFWTLRAENIVLDQAARRGYARKVSLRLGEVPIFYYPFTMPFPLGESRSSGFLAPSTGNTRTGGADFELPYYFNLAPHYDATVAPRLISDRGVMVSAEARYLASWSMNTLNMSLLAGDDQFDPALKDQPFSDSPPVADRWFLGFDHQGALGPNWSTFIDYNAVSDNDYFYDLGATGLNVTTQTHLNREGRIDYRANWLRAGLNAQRIQVIDPFAAAVNINKPYDRLPQFYFDTDANLPGGFNLGLTGQVTSFDRQLDENSLSPELIDSGALVTGERVNLEPSLNWSLEAPGWFLRSSATYKYTGYRLEDQAVSTLADPDVTVPVYTADAGLVFERSRRGGSQTLEPRLFYLYSEYQDQSNLPLFDTSELNFSFNQLFRDDRFSGGDRIADADQLALALTTRLLNERGEEQARFSLGQIRYFQDRQVSLSNPLQAWQPRYATTTDSSSLVGEVALNLLDSWRFSTDLQWNEDRHDFDEANVQLGYQRDRDHVFNFAYRYRLLIDSPFFIVPPGIDPRIKQTDLSGVWPLNENWTLLGRWNYDLANERNLETFAGLQWRNCCATIRLVAREWVDENELFLPNSEPNQGIFVQFTLNGLGNLAGGGLSTLLQDGIWGFRDSEFN